MHSFTLRLTTVVFTLLWCANAVSVEAAAVEIAILKSSDLKAYNDAIEGFKATAPGTSIYVEYDLRGDLELGKQLAKKIRGSDPALVVAVGLKAALAAKLEIAEIPVLYMMIPNPLTHGLTAKNMTGVPLDVPTDRQFKILRTMLPTARRIGMLYDPNKTTNQLRQAEPEAALHDFQLRGFPVKNEKELSQQLRILLSESDVLWLVPDSTVLTDESLRFILESAVTKQVPVMGFSSELTRLGALVSLSVNYAEVGRETSSLAKRILDGGKPFSLKPTPVQHVRVTVNLKTARYLGITIPREIESLIDETY